MTYPEWITGYADEIKKCTFDPNAKLLRLRTATGPVYIRDGTFIQTPECAICIEEFAPGQGIAPIFPHSEFQYVLAGKAEITYSLPSDFWMQKRTFTAEAGDFYMIPRGAKVEFKTDPSGPYRHLAVIMPSPAPIPDIQLEEVDTYD